jgi:hypothetical protein
VNSGLFGAALTHRKTGWISVGGDADNDYAADFHGMKLSYGRKSGAGGAGSQKVGARIF